MLGQPSRNRRTRRHRWEESHARASSDKTHPRNSSAQLGYGQSALEIGQSVEARRLVGGTPLCHGFKITGVSQRRCIRESQVRNQAAELKRPGQVAKDKRFKFLT